MADANAATPGGGRGDDDELIIHHPPGYRLRRVQNWMLLGLTYASYYACRYNLGIVAPQIKSVLGFSNSQYSAIQAGRNGAYAIGQIVNGLFTDRLGGKQAMTIGAIGTIILNILFGLTAWSNIGWLFFALLIIRAADGYVQAFGAPGMVKINTAWFRRRERGSFAGIFGIMINLGQTAVAQIGPLLVTGFAVPLIFFTITVPAVDWRFIFFVPPVLVTIIVILMNVGVKNHPEEAGYRIVHDEEHADDDPHERIHVAEVFWKIASNPVVWIVAGAYFCTGFVRSAIFEWYTIYLDEVWNVGLQTDLFWWFAVILLPMLASAGSLGSGIISDKLFRGRRSAVAAVLYFIQVLFILAAIAMSLGSFHATAIVSVVLILGIHTGCNATHSILGTAAAMDLGGRKMAGFSAGVIDSFQYFGAMLQGFGVGKLLDHYERSASGGGFNSTVWFLSMLPFGILGTGLMGYLWYKNRGKDTAGA
jgi:OPA family glycerol-3-phosphate transporter-like MFS transporter